MGVLPRFCILVEIPFLILHKSPVVICKFGAIKTHKMIFDLFKSSEKKNHTPESYFSKEYIDIHSHILPGIDDGAETTEDSLRLLRKMRKLGIRNFVCTPHVIEGMWENSSETILRICEKLKENMKSTPELADVQIRAAAEYMMDDNFHQLLQQQDILPIKDDKILVEMSYLAPPANLFETIAEIQVKGYVPILAHPERYSFYHGDPSAYEQLKASGCFFQLNMMSLTNYYGKEVHDCALWLLRQNMIDFVGSDLHHMRHMGVIKSLNTREDMMALLKPAILNNHQLR